MTRVFRLNLAAGLTAATAIALAAHMPAPVHMILPDREAQRAWSAHLDREFGPVLADCVRFEVEGHVPPVQLEAMLARASGDARLFPYLRQTVETAIARCLRRHPTE
jgi:hypothetical protein